MVPDRVAIPQFPSRDLAATRDFYERLGFSCALHAPEPDPFLILTHPPIELHFWSDASIPPDRSIMSAYIRFKSREDLESLHRTWSRVGLPSQGIPRLVQPADRPWGMREFYVVDPDGTLLKFGTPIVPSDGADRESP